MPHYAAGPHGSRIATLAQPSTTRSTIGPGNLAKLTVFFWSIFIVVGVSMVAVPTVDLSGKIIGAGIVVTALFFSWREMEWVSADTSGLCRKRLLRRRFIPIDQIAPQWAASIQGVMQNQTVPIVVLSNGDLVELASLRTSTPDGTDEVQARLRDGLGLESEVH